MRSKEYAYFDDGYATGFRKNYTGGRYSFIALLPNEGVSLADYVKTLANTAPEKVVKMLTSPQSTSVQATMPKFGYDFELRLNDILIALGLSDVFDASKSKPFKARKMQRRKQPLYKRSFA